MLGTYYYHEILRKTVIAFGTLFNDIHICKKRLSLVKKYKFDPHLSLAYGLFENLDKVIKIIRSSKTPEDAKKSILNIKWKINKSQKMISLIEGKRSKNTYSLSEAQVVAILELRLQKLTALGINEIEEEIKKLSDLITKYKK